MTRGYTCDFNECAEKAVWQRMLAPYTYGCLDHIPAGIVVAL